MVIAGSILSRLGRGIPPAISFAVVLGACAGSQDTTNLHLDRDVVAVVGLDSSNVRMCAGMPSAITITGEDEEIWFYQTSIPRRDLSLGIPIPVLGAATGNVSLNNSTSCSTQFRFVDGRVVEAYPSGLTRLMGEQQAYCMTKIDECANYARSHK
ncbi:hypothetical protein [Paenirhodobacter populi]|uniref:Uncharacterized protein n=1 Tax=Paenirhodobacter populi TaxID=2306993 RepID=A0A443JH27_9RHOB|nr:hypothetical protein [Sinirhodobacter populi]RWR19879.1 hypothetical protein D2T30_13010 [Sinirhodobacter populi]